MIARSTHHYIIFLLSVCAILKVTGSRFDLEAWVDISEHRTQRGWRARHGKDSCLNGQMTVRSEQPKCCKEESSTLAALTMDGDCVLDFCLERDFDDSS